MEAPLYANPDNQEMTETSPNPAKTGKKRDVFYVAVIAILAAAMIYFIVDNGKLRQNLAAARSNVQTLESDGSINKSQRLALLERVDSLDEELEVQRGLSGELDHLVDSLRDVLQIKKQEIERNKNLSNAEIADLKKELENTKAAYLAMIADLKTQLGIVEAENVELKDSIVKSHEREEVLTAKVKTGEVMQTNNDLYATAVTTKAGGKEKETDIAKNAERIKVCFSFVENRLASAGNKNVLLRIVNPAGETMMVEALGGGSFTTANGEQSLYTTRADIAYDPNDPGRNRCITWTPQSELAAGPYTVELYHEGHRIGKTNMVLKKGIL